VVHFEEDILVLDLTKLIKVVQEAKKRYPNAKLVLWASLECTNFSNAKGGQPRDADSRTLAWGLIRYLQAIAFDYVMIENVSEFQDCIH
jgi:DNA (cytosine-5)-methyltransferase 1